MIWKRRRKKMRNRRRNFKKNKFGTVRGGKITQHKPTCLPTPRMLLKNNNAQPH